MINVRYMAMIAFLSVAFLAFCEDGLLTGGVFLLIAVHVLDIRIPRSEITHTLLCSRSEHSQKPTGKPVDGKGAPSP